MENRGKAVLHKTLGLEPEMIFVCPGNSAGQTKPDSFIISNRIIRVFRLAEPVSEKVFLARKET